MSVQEDKQRHYGLFGAASAGIGAIVGGGILVLGGAALDQTGSSAFLAFLLNGLIAFLTVLSVAEMSTLFPESGGIYTFAKRVLSIRAGFAFGWILWFAHLVAALLYAVGFSVYFAEALRVLSLSVFGVQILWFDTPQGRFTVASLSVLFYSLMLIRSAGSSSSRENAVKLLVFALLIGGGGYAFLNTPNGSLAESFSPFLPRGMAGLGAAMGLSFIALQGFEVIAGVAGEIKEPSKTIPRAMFISLAAALMIYIPLLFVVVAAGVPQGERVHEWCAVREGTCLADAARNFMGPAGFWLVVVAALFSTLSALQANLLSASRLVQRMADDRTLPRLFARLHLGYQTPAAAITANLVAIVFLLGLVRTVDIAGSAASLVFLVVYACSHALGVAARKRSSRVGNVFRTPYFPLIQVVGGAACVGLAIFQGLAEPAAGTIVIVWLLCGVVLYQIYFSRRAETVDAYIQALRPELIAYRGFTPLVLVPITNPKTAPELVCIAHALAAHEAGKVLLLKVVSTAGKSDQDELRGEILKANEVLNSALLTSVSESGNPAEMLLTLSDSPWREISRVARQHNCHSLVLGVNRFDWTPIESLLKQLDGDVAILSAPPDWSLKQARKILVPVGGRAYHDALRARVLGTLLRSGLDEICLLSVLRADVSAAKKRALLRQLQNRAQDEAGGIGAPLVVSSDNASQTIVDTAAGYDLLVLGLARTDRGKMEMGTVAEEVAKAAPCATLIIGKGS